MGDRNRFNPFGGKKGERPRAAVAGVAAALEGAVAPVVKSPGRELVELDAVVHSVAQTDRGGAPSLEATIEDEAGPITLVWLGRRRLAGVEPGRRIVVSARVAVHGGERVMYNPRYELKF